jgi:hypothetical protein
MAVMNIRKIFIILLIIVGGFAAEAQQSKRKTKKAPARKTVVKAKKAPPTWAPAKGYTGKEHVYFPDYHAFYDPKRGYVYWNPSTTNWTASPQPPKFMSSVDMSKTRIQLIKDLSLDLHPEANYPNYMKLYPPKRDFPDVPVPNHRQGYK